MHFFTPVFKQMPLSRKIAYTAVMLALSVIANMYSITISSGIAKFSLVSSVLVISGAIFGPLIGFVIGFLGDALGFLVFADGLYHPGIGISNGVFAMIAGFVFVYLPKNRLALKVIVSFAVSYIICTLLLTSLALYQILNVRATFFVWVLSRVPVQTPFSIANAVICYFILRALTKVKTFKFNVS